MTPLIRTKWRSTMGNKTAGQHDREHGSLLAAAEKRLLVWIAERLPIWVNSDHLSLLGLFAMLAAGLAFWAASSNRPWLLGVVLALAINWFGDSLDGTLARVRNQQRPRYGFYVDHVIDLAGALLLFGGMGVSSYMNSTVALGLLVAYMMVSAESYLATHTRKVFKLSFMRVGPAELRILLAVGAVFLMFKPWVTIAGQSYLLLDVGGVVATAGLGLAFVVSAVRNTVALYREEPVLAQPVSEVRRPHRNRENMTTLERMPLVSS